MRKQTKVVAVASAAALLAIGGAMTSFAAQGWVEEDGTWYYYDKDGNKVENEWKKSGDNWFWLDGEEGGAMATDKIVVDDKDNTYYVDGNGVMVTNTWVKVVNEDQDDDDDPAEYRYYYMQSSGKAYKASNNSNVQFKTIDGKRYAFDEDGKMLYGWVKKSEPNLATDDEDWKDCTYYLGSWEDGSMKTGWQRITVWDEDKEDDMDYWFNFKSNGEKRYNNTSSSSVYTKKINGKTYGFDERGVMVYEWTMASSGNVASATSVSNWLYFSSPEDGARYTKGWFKVVAPDNDGDDNTFKDYSNNPTFAGADANDENERWYYADGDGQLYEGQIKKIKGKYYGFAPEANDHSVGKNSAGSKTGKAGSMLTGLCALTVNNKGEITTLWARDMDSDDLDDCINGAGDFAGFWADGGSLYYFGSNEDADGAMKTGNVTINLDGDSYQFQFSKSGGSEGKGKGLTGIDDNKYIYKYGLKLKADSDDKYMIVYADGDTASASTQVEKISSQDLRNAYSDDAGVNKDGNMVHYVGTIGAGLVNGSVSKSDYYLVNTSGTIDKNKTAAKDGDDWYFYVDNKVIKMYTSEKDLNDGTSTTTKLDDLNSNWNKTTAVINATDATKANVAYDTTNRVSLAPSSDLIKK